MRDSWNWILHLMEPPGRREPGSQWPYGASGLDERESTLECLPDQGALLQGQPVLQCLPSFLASQPAQGDGDGLSDFRFPILQLGDERGDGIQPHATAQGASRARSANSDQ